MYKRPYCLEFTQHPCFVNLQCVLPYIPRPCFLKRRLGRRTTATTVSTIVSVAGMASGLSLFLFSLFLSPSSRPIVSHIACLKSTCLSRFFCNCNNDPQSRPSATNTPRVRDGIRKVPPLGPTIKAAKRRFGGAMGAQAAGAQPSHTFSHYYIYHINSSRRTI